MILLAPAVNAGVASHCLLSLVGDAIVGNGSKTRQTGRQSIIHLHELPAVNTVDVECCICLVEWV
jgi:hypothetical protein